MRDGEGDEAAKEERCGGRAEGHGEYDSEDGGEPDSGVDGLLLDFLFHFSCPQVYAEQFEQEHGGEDEDGSEQPEEVILQPDGHVGHGEQAADEQEAEYDVGEGLSGDVDESGEQGVFRVVDFACDEGDRGDVGGHEAGADGGEEAEPEGEASRADELVH